MSGVLARVGALGLGLGLVLGASACGGGGADEPGATPTPSSAPGPSSSAPSGSTSIGPDDPEPTLTQAPPSATTRVSGVVERSPEDRCLVLSTDGTPAAWVLTGAVAGLEPGDRVTVLGRPDPDATTTCQSGPVLVVVEVER